MNRDDHLIRENVTPILPYQVPVTRPRRTIDDWQRSLLDEVDDLHAADGRLRARVKLLQIGVVALLWHALGFWPLPWLWDLAATSYQTIFVAGGLIGLGVAGLLAALPSLVRRYGWMN